MTDAPHPMTPQREEQSGEAAMRPLRCGLAVARAGEICGFYLMVFDPETGIAEISLDGTVIAQLGGSGARDMFEHVRSLKSAGAKSIFIDGVLFALRASEVQA